MVRDTIIYSRPVVVPEVPTLGYIGQHFNRSAIPGNPAPAYGDDVIYMMIGQQQLITAPNISIRGVPGHQAYKGLAGIPTTDRDGC